MDRADRLLKRTAVKKEPLEETDSENWTTIARDVIGESEGGGEKEGRNLEKVEKKKKETTEEKKADDPTKEKEKKTSEVPPLPAVVSTMAIEKVPGWAVIAIPYNYNELRAAFMDYNDFKWAAGKLNIQDHCNDQFLRDNWEAWRSLAAPELKFVETRKSFLHYAGLEETAFPSTGQLST
ncbi:hypothetical protein R1sor_005793 [Riccia sorocarpa]|uniref:Uncharacterized protein n=1 Tax=Riccia sorocarpa TaxID=122646 RepID=A0ABD3HP40_9MARC